MAERACYFAVECAELLGMHVDTFYRQFDALLADGMPAPLPGGKIRISRQAFDRWLNNPLRARAAAPPAPANDVDLSSPVSLDAHRERLAQAYRRRA